MINCVANVTTKSSSTFDGKVAGKTEPPTNPERTPFARTTARVVSVYNHMIPCISVKGPGEHESNLLESISVGGSGNDKLEGEGRQNKLNSTVGPLVAAGRRSEDAEAK